MRPQYSKGLRTDSLQSGHLLWVYGVPALRLRSRSLEVLSQSGAERIRDRMGATYRR